MKERKKGNQHIKKEKSNKVCVLHAIKHQNYLEVYAIFFAGFNQTCPKYLTNLQCLCDVSRKKLRNEVNFLHAFFVSKFSINWHYYFWLVWPGIPKVPKIMSLQYLRNNMLHYLDFWYVPRPPSHTQSIENNRSAMSQKLYARLPWFFCIQIDLNTFELV